MRKNLRSIIILIVLLLILPLTIYLAKNFQQYLTKAAFLPANIVVDADKVIGPATSPWQALAQGGEMEENRQTPVFFSDVAQKLTAISPKYIRIDHLYDFYHVVSRNSDNSLSYNWQELDKMVDDILKAGAIPFFSLSYMPSSIAKNGDIIGLPNSWTDWENVIKATIEHYSGTNQRNLTNVYYEVWNEPDLFGKWTIGQAKDYRLLYQFAVYGAQKAINVNPFKIGGPATTNPIKIWTDDFLTFIETNNLRLDFLSWHRYSFDPQQFNRDLLNVNNWLSRHPRFQTIEKIISEWGSDSENNPVHDSNFDAIHTLAVSRQLINQVNLAFSFEIKDSPGPNDKQFWGRWGIFTHQKFGLVAKPRYFAFSFLNNLVNGDRLALTGEGTDVTAWTVKNGETIKTLIVNYPISKNGQQQAVPIKLINLKNGVYSYKETFFSGQVNKADLPISNGVWEKTLNLPAYQAVIIELTKVSDLATFETGKFGYLNDQSLVLDKNNPALTIPINQLMPEGTVEFWLKSDFDGGTISDQFFLDIPLAGGLNLSAKKELAGFGNEIHYGIFNKGKSINFQSVDITLWQPGEWHYLAFSWQKIAANDLSLSLFLDGKTQTKTINNQSINQIGNIFVGGYKGNLEELRISKIVRNPTPYYLLGQLTNDKDTLILKHFDGTL